MLGKHIMPNGDMMEDSMMESTMPGASMQAEALAADADIQAFHKKLAAKGAAAAQPNSSMRGMEGMGELASEGREDSLLEDMPDDPGDY